MFGKLAPALQFVGALKEKGSKKMKGDSDDWGTLESRLQARKSKAIAVSRIEGGTLCQKIFLNRQRFGYIYMIIDQRHIPVFVIFRWRPVVDCTSTSS
jgi:hypothetical protein